MLWLGAGSIVVTVPVVLGHGTAAKELPWVAGTAIFLAVATLVWRRRPDLPIAGWFATTAGLVALVQTFDGLG